ncbi:MAG: Hypothetical protein, DUF4382 family [Candidatus Methanohalarchaeum thermophilum]|uniref:DUF4382 domain-containing protein n=1 Tax=Methanohalarchaeum thermophilum TaxID=1903181 RepID=A0A1Q6DWH1_METT1|nr:MAG: Hypothetical protein, DUF4382 family [Candidatus Methanohalarchaeum thermophilum]
MNKKYLYSILVVSLLLVAAIGFSGCLEQQEAGNGNFELYISDRKADIDDFDSLDVTFDQARIFNANDSFAVYDLNETEVDLTKLKGANATEILNTTLDPGNYTKIELYVTGTEGIVNGTEVGVKVPSEKLQIQSNFTIERDETTRFVFDITVVEKGATGEYNLIPVISESGVNKQVNAK